jgi:hypothetical protein
MKINGIYLVVRNSGAVGSLGAACINTVILGLVPRICRGVVWAVRALILVPVDDP